MTNQPTDPKPPTFGGSPKDQYTQQMVEEWLDTLGEGARREMEAD